MKTWSLPFFIVLAFSISTAKADNTSWEVHSCLTRDLSRCDCPDPAVPAKVSFHLPDLLGYTTYRCVPGHLALRRQIEILPWATNPFSPIEGCSPNGAPLPKSASGYDGECFDLPLPACNVQQFPKNCGYEWKKFNLAAFRKAVEVAKTSNRILCGNPYSPMCTSAVFLAFVQRAKAWLATKKITPAQFESLTDVDGDAWKFINAQARPDLLATTLTMKDGKPLGQAKTLRPSDLPDPAWPAPGDIVQLWRKNRSGHSVVFQGYWSDANGKKIGLCYWSANQNTDGYATRCERMSEFKTVIVGRLRE